MKRIIISSMLVSTISLAFTSFFCVPIKLIYNASASATIGFYWIDDEPVTYGDMVLVQLPDRVINLVERRQYLPPNVPLIKRIAAAKGDKICRVGVLLSINNIPVAVAKIKDKQARKLPVWSGCITLGAGSFFLLQEHPNSFDSRYFGPVDRKMIVGRARKLRPFGALR